MLLLQVVGAQRSGRSSVRMVPCLTLTLGMRSGGEGVVTTTTPHVAAARGQRREPRAGAAGGRRAGVVVDLLLLVVAVVVPLALRGVVGLCLPLGSVVVVDGGGPIGGVCGTERRRGGEVPQPRRRGEGGVHVDVGVGRVVGAVVVVVVGAGEEVVVVVEGGGGCRGRGGGGGGVHLAEHVRLAGGGGDDFGVDDHAPVAGREARDAF